MTVMGSGKFMVRLPHAAFNAVMAGPTIVVPCRRDDDHNAAAVRRHPFGRHDVQCPSGARRPDQLAAPPARPQRPASLGRRAPGGAGQVSGQRAIRGRPIGLCRTRHAQHAQGRGLAGGGRWRWRRCRTLVRSRGPQPPLRPQSAGDLLSGVASRYRLWQFRRGLDLQPRRRHPHCPSRYRPYAVPHVDATGPADRSGLQFLRGQHQHRRSISAGARLHARPRHRDAGAARRQRGRHRVHGRPDLQRRYRRRSRRVGGAGAHRSVGDPSLFGSDGAGARLCIGAARGRPLRRRLPQSWRTAVEGLGRGGKSAVRGGHRGCRGFGRQLQPRGRRCGDALHRLPFGLLPRRHRDRRDLRQGPLHHQRFRRHAGLLGSRQGDAQGHRRLHAQCAVDGLPERPQSAGT